MIQYKNDRKKAKRIDFIDIAKGIGIILVCYAHIRFYCPAEVKNFIYLFHMPLFVLCSGLITTKNPFLMRLKKNMKIVYAYYIFGFVFLFLLSTQPILLGIKNILLATPNSVLKVQAFGAAWFLTALFLIKVTYQHWKYSTVLYLFLFFFTTLFLDDYINFSNAFYALGSALVLGIYFDVGYKLKEYFLKPFSYIKLMILSLLSVLFFFYFLHQYGFEDNNTVYQRAIIKVPEIAIIVAVLFSSLIIEIAKLIEKIPYLKQVFILIGNSALIVFMTHTRVYQFLIQEYLYKQYVYDYPVKFTIASCAYHAGYCFDCRDID
jgi:fucose 4-O-acetylase-like acetyltransferase